MKFILVIPSPEIITIIISVVISELSPPSNSTSPSVTTRALLIPHFLKDIPPVSCCTVRAFPKMSNMKSQWNCDAVCFSLVKVINSVDTSILLFLWPVIHFSTSVSSKLRPFWNVWKSAYPSSASLVLSLAFSIHI